MAVTSYAAESPPGRILAHLQRHGEATVRDLEVLLGISTTAVREHLAHLEAKGLLGTRLIRNGPGRPRLVYFLTARAQELFPKEYDTLVTLLIREIASREGPDRLRSLLDAVSARMAEEYGGQASGAGLAERLEQLRGTLEARGIPVEVQIQDQRVDLHMFSCPYHDVAQEHPAVCAMDLRTIERVLGETIQLEGTIREGQRSCRFLVRRDAPADEAPAEATS